MNIFWTPRALRDLEDIHAYIKAENIKAADQLTGHIIELVETELPDNPRRGRPGRVSGTRELVAHPNYLIAYRVQEARIEILAVVHAARLWPEGF